jgi:hypothetical protein
MKVISKRNWYFYSYVIIFLVFLAFPLIMVKEVVFKGLFDLGGLFIIFLTSPLPFIFGLYIWRFGHFVEVDRVAKTISFKNFFIRIERKYHFSELDGYVTGRARYPKDITRYKVIWIVINGKMRFCIDEYFTKNQSEIENEVKDLKYLGYQVFSPWKLLKMIFVRVKIE